MKPQLVGVDENGGIWSDGIRRSPDDVRAMFCAPQRQGREHLTERERAVLKHVAEGRSNKEIGNVLGIRCFTVAEHLKRIFEVLEARDRAHAVAIALRKGFIS